MNDSPEPEEERPSRPASPNVVEGTYLPPEPHPASGRNWKAAGGTAVGFAVLAAKFKGLLFALLNLKWIFFAGKFALTGFSFLASIWFYALFFGWKFAIVLVLLIAIHELGHLIFVRGYGLSAPGIVFLPGLGAFTSWTGGNTTVYQESVIAFGGPLLGTIGGLVCFAYGAATNEPFWYAAANTAFFLNLFNMIPLGVFDGGRMTAAISPNLWILGFVIVVGAAVAFHWWSPILLLVVALSIPRAIEAFRGKLDPRYYAVPAAQKMTISIAYFGLLAVLLACLVFSRVNVPGHALG
ncbi:MAG: site-2 protease family protein [Candidatus Eremiobacteraeota bacterium]|nr:site-2 protease family protein [Candidatus Eremiobacteraeota bacterium]